MSRQYDETVPLWIKNDYDNAYTTAGRYEAEFYGVLNCFLVVLYPPHQNFKVTPQAVLRPAYISRELSDASQQAQPGSQSSESESESGFDSDSAMSYDASDNTPVLSRSVPG